MMKFIDIVKSLEIAGLCIVGVLALGMVAATAASAAPVWEQCTEGSTTTKYTEDNCKVAEASGKWGWKAIPAGTPGTVHITGSTLILKDTKVPIVGTVEVICNTEGEGTAGGSIGKVDTFAIKSCTAGKNCEKVGSAEPRDLPWETEFFETEKKVFQTLKGAGAGEPGWSVSCTVLGIKETDECKSVAGKPEEHEDDNEITGNEWLLLEIIEPLKRWKCSVGGEEAGEASVSIDILRRGTGLRVS
jgi:hypothetical protein